MRAPPRRDEGGQSNDCAGEAARVAIAAVFGGRSNTLAFNVFVSYSTKDLPLVARVQRVLADASIQVFIAEHTVHPGDSLAAKITTAIESCDLFILLWSRGSKESAWVEQEVGMALGRKKPVLPILLTHGLELPGFLMGIKYLRAHQDVEKALAWLKQNVYERAQAKQGSEGLAWLGVGAAVLLILSSE